MQNLLKPLMKEVEYFRHTLIEATSLDSSEKYLQASRTVQSAISVAIDLLENPSAPKLIDIQNSPENVAHILDPNNPATIAAMLLGAISSRAHLYRNPFSPQEPIKYREIWKETPLESLAAKCDEIVEEIRPNFSSKFAEISLVNMKAEFLNNIKEGGPEHIILTGLNGVGKTLMIRALRDIIKVTGINGKIVKFPQPKGLLSETIQKILKGRDNFNSQALQMLFLSDALSLPEEPETLLVFDRHPQTDALVFGPESLETTILTARELFPGSYWTFIIDRHPLAAKSDVSKRKQEPRIFERDLEKMVDQVIRFAKLTVLPGTIWVNNDIPENSKISSYPVRLSVRRFIGAILNNGVLQRHMLKQGRAENYEEASSKLLGALMEVLYKREEIDFRVWS